MRRPRRRRDKLAIRDGIAYIDIGELPACQPHFGRPTWRTPRDYPSLLHLLHFRRQTTLHFWHFWGQTTPDLQQNMQKMGSAPILKTGLRAA